MEGMDRRRTENGFEFYLGWLDWGGELSKKEKKKCIKLMRLDDVEWNGKGNFYSGSLLSTQHSSLEKCAIFVWDWL